MEAEDYYTLEENPHCTTNLTVDQKYSSFALSGVCFLSLVISIPAVLFALHEYCIKSRLSELRTERLLMYLVCSAGVGSVVGCFHWIGPQSHNSQVAKTGCQVIGYLWIMISTVVFLITFFIGIHFLIQIANLKVLRKTSEKRKIIAKRLEIFYISATLVATALFTPWPFLSKSFGYNLWICWIITTNRNCKIITVPATEVTVYYSVVLGIALFSFLVMLVVHILICSRKRNFSNLYVWAFSIYLVSIMLNFIVTLVVNFLNPDDVPPLLNFIKIASLGLIPLTASTVTLMAVIYKKYFSNKHSKRSNSKQHKKYNSITTGVKLETSIGIDSRFRNTGTSREPTTTWEPPPTWVGDGERDTKQTIEGSLGEGYIDEDHVLL